MPDIKTLIKDDTGDDVQATRVIWSYTLAAKDLSMVVNPKHSFYLFMAHHVMAPFLRGEDSRPQSSLLQPEPEPEVEIAMYR